MSNDFETTPLLSCIQEQSYDLLHRRLLENGFTIFELHGEAIEDAESFFAEVIRKLPLDPPLSGNVNWDALNDSLWEGLSELGSRKVAILWTAPTHMVNRSLAEFLTAIICFRQVALSLADLRSGVPSPVALLVYLIGDGPSFQPFW